MSTKEPIAVAIVGTGLVGSELISQILALPSPSPFRIVYIASSKHHVSSLNRSSSPSALDISSSSWKTLLASSPTPGPAFLKQLAEQLSALSTRAILVDNTSSLVVAESYPEFLGRGVHVVTPNKKAGSENQELYERIMGAAGGKGGGVWLAEATVGAGLPIVGVLKDLVATGDKVKKIEGVFSGTMSYIFNNFSTTEAGGPAFSEVVKIAKEKGYTEPHPADDLKGADVARKLTILTRLIPSFRNAFPRGYLFVNTTTLVPDALATITSGEEFVEKLKEYDAGFDELREEARAEGKVLRYVGVVDVEKGVVKADLERYSVDHPFATSLGGSDNIVMFHTERYSPRPLIVQGAGAGAAVTAMGVLSDMLRLTL